MNKVDVKEEENRTSSPSSGVKHDQGKARWDLLPFKAVSHIVDVVTFGAKKYAPDNWQTVPDGKARYLAATFRHLSAYAQGEKKDLESGLPHLAHAGCCILFLLWLEDQP